MSDGMDCARTRFLLNAFGDGELSDADRRAVALHLSRCVRCAMRLESLGRLRAILKNCSPRRSVPIDLKRRIAERRAPVRGWRRYLRPAAGLAVLGILVLPVVADSGVRPLSEANLLGERPVERIVRGKFFCLRCALKSRLDASTVKRAAGPSPHVPAFRGDDGNVWILLNRDACPDSLPEGEVDVTGRFFLASHLVAAETIR